MYISAHDIVWFLIVCGVAFGVMWLIHCWSDWHERRKEPHGYVPLDAPIPPRTPCTPPSPQ